MKITHNIMVKINAAKYIFMTLTSLPLLFFSILATFLTCFLPSSVWFYVRFLLDSCHITGFLLTWLQVNQESFEGFDMSPFLDMHENLSLFLVSSVHWTYFFLSVSELCPAHILISYKESANISLLGQAPFKIHPALSSILLFYHKKLLSTYMFFTTHVPSLSGYNPNPQ